MGCFTYFIGDDGFSHRVDELDEFYFNKPLKESYLLFNLVYTPDSLQEEFENHWNEFFDGVSFSNILEKSHINIRNSNRDTEDSPIIVEWFYESYYDEWNGDYDSNSECISIKAVFDRTPGREIILNYDLIY